MVHWRGRPERNLVDENHLVSERVIEGKHVFYRAEIIAHFHLDIKFLLKLSNERISAVLAELDTTSYRSIEPLSSLGSYNSDTKISCSRRGTPIVRGRIRSQDMVEAKCGFKQNSGGYVRSCRVKQVMSPDIV